MDGFKLRGLIKLFLVLIGIIGAGIANGFCCVRFEFPEAFGYMALPTALCVGLLIWHWHFSKNWEKPLTQWDDGFHNKWFLFLFSMSLLVLLVHLVVWIISGKTVTSILVASITTTIASGIASVREDDYADGWISIAG